MIIKNLKNNKVDISELINDFQEKYKNIYLFQFGDQVFIYKSVGRKEFKDIMNNENIGDQEREEYLCSLCTLFPKNFDFANCEEAGLPTRLAEEIYNNSYLSKENRDKVLDYHRNEMYDLDNQINCIISAAFPQMSLEEIENWDVVTASKYYSRAEWILHNINGIPIKQKDSNSQYTTDQKFIQSKEITDDDVIVTSKSNNKNSKRQQMTPEKLAELEAKYPDIDWRNDNGRDGVEGMLAQATVDTTPVANMTPSQLKGLRLRN
jgi:hypothetical protein